MSDLKVGDIVQINPEIEHQWGGFFVIVTEPRKSFFQGMLMSPKEFQACKCDGVAYVRINNEDCVYCGRCEWLLRHHDEN